MSKPFRGKNIKKDGWRGTCPICKKARVKLLWSKVVDEKTEKCCKVCGK